MSNDASVLLQLAKPRIEQVVVAKQGNLSHAAKELGVTYRTLTRWVAVLKMEATVDKARSPQQRARAQQQRQLRRGT